MSSKPNRLLVLAADMGFSDLGCFGAAIRTPVLEEWAGRGVVRPGLR